MKKTAQIIAVCNHKGGVGKTVTAACLSSALADNGKTVLLVDMDPQGNLTNGLGKRAESTERSIKDLFTDELSEKQKRYSDYIVSVAQKEDLIPANISFAGMEMSLSTVMSRETLFRRAIEPFRAHYDYIIIDSSPTLNLLTINAMCAADKIIIPVQSEPYAVEGLEDLLQTIRTAKKQLNPTLTIDGILITMTDVRTNLSQQITANIRAMFANYVNVYQTEIPRCVKTAEATLYKQNPIAYAPNSASAKAYAKFAKEVIKRNDEKDIALTVQHGISK